MWKENLPNNCPPLTAIETNCEAFRILKNATPSEDDFIPYARLYKDNPRYNKLCVAYALSFYNTFDKALAAHKKALGRGNNIGKYVGKFNINKTDGKNKFNNKSGHINTWFYVTWNLNNFPVFSVRKVI